VAAVVAGKAKPRALKELVAMMVVPTAVVLLVVAAVMEAAAKVQESAATVEVEVMALAKVAVELVFFGEASNF